MTATRVKDRRGPDRRQIGERRRQAEGRCAVFEVCRSMLHLALVVRTTSGDDNGDNGDGVQGVRGSTRLEAKRQRRRDGRDAGRRRVPILTEALKDRDKFVRHGAAVTLGFMGKEAGSAGPGLREALKD